MFINSLVYSIHNVRSRTTRRTTKDSKSERKTFRNRGNRIAGIQEVSCRSKFSRRIEKGCRQLCKQAKQYQYDIEAKGNTKGQSWTQAKERLTLLLFFIIYNPQLMILIIYIDQFFIDELIQLSSIRLVSIYHDIHTLYNLAGE